MRPRKRSPTRGFTLLEVMVATAILGLTLTVILSAEGGLAATDKTANLMGTGLSLGRCKMTELEEKLLKFGYPPVDQQDDDTYCCNDEEVPGFKCDTRIQLVILPNPPSSQTGADGGLGLSPSATAMGSAGPGGVPSIPGLPGPLGQALGGAGGGLDLDGGSLATLSFDGGLASLGTTLQSQMGLGTGAGAQGLVSMVLGFVYPMLKPMMEASIRRLLVTVHWKEGPNARELTLVQYVTNPQSGGFIAGAPVASGSAAPGGAPPPGAGAGAFPPTPFGQAMSNANSPFGGAPVGGRPAGATGGF